MGHQFIVRSQGLKQNLNLKTVVYDGVNITRFDEDDGTAVYEINDQDLVLELIIRPKYADDNVLTKDIIYAGPKDPPLLTSTPPIKDITNSADQWSNRTLKQKPRPLQITPFMEMHTSFAANILKNQQRRETTKVVTPQLAKKHPPTPRSVAADTRKFKTSFEADKKPTVSPSDIDGGISHSADAHQKSVAVDTPGDQQMKGPLKICAEFVSQLVGRKGSVAAGSGALKSNSDTSKQVANYSTEDDSVANLKDHNQYHGDTNKFAPQDRQVIKRPLNVVSKDESDGEDNQMKRLKPLPLLNWAPMEMRTSVPGEASLKDPPNENDPVQQKPLPLLNWVPIPSVPNSRKHPPYYPPPLEGPRLPRNELSGWKEVARSSRKALKAEERKAKESLDFEGLNSQLRQLVWDLKAPAVNDDVVTSEWPESILPFEEYSGMSGIITAASNQNYTFAEAHAVGTATTKGVSESPESVLPHVEDSVNVGIIRTSSLKNAFDESVITMRGGDHLQDFNDDDRSSAMDLFEESDDDDDEQLNPALGPFEEEGDNANEQLNPIMPPPEVHENAENEDEQAELIMGPFDDFPVMGVFEDNVDCNDDEWRMFIRELPLEGL